MGICLFLTLVGMDLEFQSKYDVGYRFQINNLSMERTSEWIIESVSSLPQSAKAGLHPESGVPPQLLCL